MRKTVIVAGIALGLTTALGASAQETDGQASGQANVGMSLPGATPAAAATGASDHDQMVGRLAVGYLGRATVGAGSLAPGVAPGAARRGPGAAPARPRPPARVVLALGVVRVALAWPHASPFTASAFSRAQTRARGDYFWLVVNVKLR